LSGNPFRQGALEAAGVPAAVLAAGYLGFGALAASQGISAPLAIASTLTIWALPAQLILFEMHTLSAPLVATVLTVSLSSARFLPMTLMLMPLMRDASHRRWHYYLIAQLLALTGWTMAIARYPAIERPQRLAWFYGFALVCLVVSAMATLAGYLIADRLSPLARTGLVFMAPMYYLLILLGAIRDRAAALALACGALAGPIAYLASPAWSVLLGGFVGGTLAYAVLRKMRGHG
jgi:predicted branched-subunit amino acid permease